MSLICDVIHSMFINCVFSDYHCHNRFDKVLCATVHQLRTLPTSLSLFHVAVRELCGMIYMMAGQYLYHAAQQLRLSVLGTSDAESIVSVHRAHWIIIGLQFNVIFVIRSIRLIVIICM